MSVRQEIRQVLSRALQFRQDPDQSSHVRYRIRYRIAYRQADRSVSALHSNLNRCRLGMTSTIGQRLLDHAVEAGAAFISQTVKIHLDLQLHWSARPL